MLWVDTHVHIFSENDSDNSGMPLLQSRNCLNTSEVYIDVLGDKKPAGVVVVDFSKSKDSEHVINSLDDLKKMGVKAAGVVKANLEDSRTLEWIKREDIKGIRLYAKDSTPDVSGDRWRNVFASIKKNNQHILVFGSGDYLINLIKQIPEDITILVDHLGLPDVYNGEDNSFKQVLSIAKERGNVYFKGPGYRTSMDVDKVKPVVNDIVASVGVDRLMLGASDGPFAGPVLDPSPEYEGKKFAEVIDYQKVLKFISELAESVSSNESDKEKILYGNAKGLYGF